MGSWGVRHKDRMFHKDPHETLKCLAHLWTHNPGRLVFQMTCQPSGSKRTCLLSFLLNLSATKSSRMEAGEVKMKAGGLSRWKCQLENAGLLECIENCAATRGRLSVPGLRLDRQDQIQEP